MSKIRSNILLKPDPSRVVFRPFNPNNRERILKIIARLMSLSDQEVSQQSQRLLDSFNDRHWKLEKFFIKRFSEVEQFLITDQVINKERKLLIGAYFTQEYALEAAALFNPSIVKHPDQSNLPEGHLRFIMSLRSTGEGHISSITFRTGTIDQNGNIKLDETSNYVTAGDASPNPSYDKKLFHRKLHELGHDTEWTREILSELSNFFTFNELQSQIQNHLNRDRFLSNDKRPNAEAILALARANYDLKFDPESLISSQVIFPHSPAESGGIEDARFVRFTKENGSIVYYGTYTAYDGSTFLPQLLETEDFHHFKIRTLNGPEVQNKGVALFPRKINGRYAMISRQDNENLYLMYSDHPHFWHEKQILMRPTYPWEFMQIGNCGSPIETDEGWLLLTHGVGYMRQYSIGAALLDLENPSRVIGRLTEPLLIPNEKEREGYVPNVVYSCGALIHQGQLIMPYALSDQCTSFARYNLKKLLQQLKTNPEIQ